MALCIYEHKEGLVDGFTKKYGVKNLVFYEMYQNVLKNGGGNGKLILFNPQILTGKIYTNKSFNGFPHPRE